MSNATVVASNPGYKSALPPTPSTDVGSYADFREPSRGCLIAPQGSSVLDKSKISADLLVHQVWSDGSRQVAYASDRRRWAVALAGIVLALSIAVALVAAGAPFWLAFFPLLLALAAAAYGSGGRTGFYELREDGSLGDFLGRTKPHGFLRKQ